MVVVVVVISKVMAYVYMLVHVLKYLLAGCCIFLSELSLVQDVDCVGLHEELHCVHRL